MSKPVVIFRADGHAKMGLGHLVRSSALAQMLNQGFDCYLVYASCPDGLLKDLRSIFSGFKVAKSIAGTKLDAQETVDYARSMAGPNEGVVIVTDGYHFDTDYQRVIKHTDIPLVCIDDIHAYPFLADVVVNHAPGVSVFYSDLILGGKLRSGLDYALLRSPFLQSHISATPINEFRRIFICFGGSDFHGLSIKATSKVLQSGREVDLVVGAAFEQEEELRKIEGSSKRLRIHRSLSAGSMASVMRSCDAAIVPASSILYEICSLNIPVISGYYVNNQERIYEGFLSEGLIHGVGDFREVVDYTSALEELLSKQKTLLLCQSEKFSGQSGDNFLKLFKSLTS